MPVQRAIFCLSLLNEADEEGAEYGGEDAGHGDGQAAHGAFDLTHLQSFAGAYGMGLTSVPTEMPAMMAAAFSFSRSHFS